MEEKWTDAEKLEILNNLLIPSLTKDMEKAYVLFNQAEEDYTNMTNREPFKRHPLLSIIEGKTQLESALTTLNNIKKLLAE